MINHYRILLISCQSVLSASVFLLLFYSSSYAQLFGPQPGEFKSLERQSVSSLEYGDQRIWIGPGLNAYETVSGEFFVPENADSVFNARGRVFSLATTGNRILAGLGFTSTRGGGSVNAAMGYYQSLNNGDSWEFLPFPLDERAPEECTAESVGPPCDLEFTYGGQTYIRTRTTVPEQSPPFEVDFYEDTILSVNWASGLLRSVDNGATWERLILPPFFESELTPDSTYQWFSQSPDGAVNRYDPRFDNNLLGFGLLIDDRQRVWVGTAGGINISENALTAPKDEISWRHITFGPDVQDGLLGNWIIKIRRQPETGRIWMTNWRADPDNRDQFGIVYTEDGGATFRRFLEGIRVNDIGFYEGVIYAASNSGLYISADDGATWNRQNRIESPNTFIKEDASFLALTSSENGIWTGSSDGLAFSSDHGSSWTIFRVNLPLSGGNIYQPDAPETDVYAYPNPFSPSIHSLIRIKFSAEIDDRPTIRIFDYAMNPVRTIRTNPVSADGSYEISWDGRTDSGRIVAGGTYFYSIDVSNGPVRGKILLLD
jgi:hypothetical protein